MKILIPSGCINPLLITMTLYYYRVVFLYVVFAVVTSHVRCQRLSINNAGNVQNGALPKPPMSGIGTSATKITGQGQNPFHYPIRSPLLGSSNGISGGNRPGSNFSYAIEKNPKTGMLDLVITERSLVPVDKNNQPLNNVPPTSSHIPDQTMEDILRMLNNPSSESFIDITDPATGKITGKLSTKDINRNEASNIQQDKTEISNDYMDHILSMINGGRPSLKNENYILLSNNQPQYDSINNDYQTSSSISSQTNGGGQKAVADQTTGGSKTQGAHLPGGEQNVGSKSVGRSERKSNVLTTTRGQKNIDGQTAADANQTKNQNMSKDRGPIITWSILNDGHQSIGGDMLKSTVKFDASRSTDYEYHAVPKGVSTSIMLSDAVSGLQSNSHFGSAPIYISDYLQEYPYRYESNSGNLQGNNRDSRTKIDYIQKMLDSVLPKRQNIDLNRADIKNVKQTTNTEIISSFQRGLKVGIDLSTFISSRTNNNPHFVDAINFKRNNAHNTEAITKATTGRNRSSNRSMNKNGRNSNRKVNIKDIGSTMPQPIPTNIYSTLLQILKRFSLKPSKVYVLPLSHSTAKVKSVNRKRKGGTSGSTGKRSMSNKGRQQRPMNKQQRPMNKKIRQDQFKRRLLNSKRSSGRTSSKFRKGVNILFSFCLKYLHTTHHLNQIQ